MKFFDKTAWLSVCWATVLLTACAGPQAGPGTPSGKSDIVTESDEPDARRRARLRLELASNYFEQGQTSVALDELKQALVVDPSFADAYSLRGLVYMRLNDVALAEDSFRRALTLSPRNPDVAHNYGWFLCQQLRYKESSQLFAQALSNPSYAGQARTLMAKGVCQVRAGQSAEAEQSFARSYELDAGNPLTGYNLANLLYDRGEYSRSQFYIRRINNGAFANAETLWLGVKVEQRLNNRDVAIQLGDQLKKRYGDSREARAYERGAFNE